MIAVLVGLAVALLWFGSLAVVLVTIGNLTLLRGRRVIWIVLSTKAPTRPALWCLICRSIETATCARCGGVACETCDCCNGCHRVVCAACDTAPVRPFQFAGDSQPHPHTEGGWWLPAVVLS